MTGPYQPPSNQPGSDGWPGGDINSPFGASDPNSPFPPSNDTPRGAENEEPSPYEGVQYELDTPGGQPPMTQPPQQYAPMSGPPAGGPVTGPPMMGGQPGYGPPQQPGYGPQFPPPQAPKKGNGAVIGGVIAAIAVVVVLVGVGLVVVLSNSDDSDGGGSGGSGDTAEDGGGGDTGGGGGNYQPVDNLCDTIDLAPIEDALAIETTPTSDTTTDSSYSTVSCSGWAGDGFDSTIDFRITGYVYPDAAGAQDAYDFESGSDGYTFEGCSVSEASGSWSSGSVGTGACSDKYQDNYSVVLAVDGNLELKVTADLTSDVGDDSAAAEIAQGMAENLMTALAA